LSAYRIDVISYNFPIYPSEIATASATVSVGLKALNSTVTEYVISGLNDPVNITIIYNCTDNIMCAEPNST